jgi:hypothetical protein
MQQIEIVDDAEKLVVRNDFAPECDDERLAAEGMDVRRSRPDPVHEGAHGR